MGVIIPNPTVETEDGSVSVTNVKKIEVTDGDLTDDGGRIVSINTAGNTTSPGGSTTEVQINDAGAFGASDKLTYTANTLSVENAIDLGATGAGGRVECTQNGQDLQIQHTGSGAVEVKNATTDNDTNLKVVGPGSGDANIIMSSTSGAGGITFPDGTTQTTAPSAGGTPVPDYSATTSGSYGQACNGSLPYGSNRTMTMTISGWHFGYMYAMPFIAQSTFTLASVNVQVITAVDNGNDTNYRVAFWSVDSDNLPGTMMGYCDFPNSDGTGTIAKTTFYDTSGSATTVSFTNGTLYYYSIVRENGPDSDTVQWRGVEWDYAAGMSGQITNPDNGGNRVQNSTTGWTTTFTASYAGADDWPIVVIS